MLGLEESAARELARRFGQNAFLSGERGDVPRLRWVELDPEAP